MKPPNNSEVEKYIDKVFDEIFNNEIDKDNIVEMFAEKFENLAKEMPVANRWRSACRIVAKKIVRDNLALRRKFVGQLLRTVRLISQQTFSEETFEEGLHTVSSEPYFHDTSYKCPASKEVTVIDRDNKCLVTESRFSIDENEYSLDGISIAVDDNGRCYLNLDDDTSSKTWKCDLTCRALDSVDKQIIIDLKNEFCDDSIDNVRDLLETLDDDCQHSHYYKFSDRLVDVEEGSDESFDLNPLEEKKGHPLPCSSGCCTSQLYTLRAAAVHYPILRTLLNNIYRARRSHCGIRDIESGLSEGSVSSLKKLLKVQELSELLDDEQSATTERECSSTSESCLEVEFAAIIETFYDKLKEDPEYTCCSCQKLLLKKVLTSFNFTTEKFKSSTWGRLKDYLLERDPEVPTQELSLSTIVLNSRDWSEIVWLPEISRFKINLAIGFIRKKPTGMHWLGYNDAASWLNKAKTRIFQPTANFEIFEIYLYFVCLPASLP